MYPLKKPSLFLTILFLALFVTSCGLSGPTTPTAASTPSAPPPTEQPSLAPATDTPNAEITPPSFATLTSTAGANNQGGATSTPAPTKPASQSGSSATEKYQYLGQSLVDHSQLLPNRQVEITWTIKNIGTTGWTKDFLLRYFSGPEPDKNSYAFNKDVPVNSTINFIVTFTTPQSPGDYDLWFKLTNSQGQNFGDLDFVFTVTSTPSKFTSTPAK